MPRKECKLKSPIDLKGLPMGAMEFLYDFMQIEEFSVLKAHWHTKNLDPTLLIYPERVIIWLLPL